MILLDEIDRVGITENREAYDIAYGKPTQVTSTAFKGHDMFGNPYQNHRLIIEMKEGYTIRLEITEDLYNTLSQTIIKEEDQ